MPNVIDGALIPAPPWGASHGLQLVVVHDVHPRAGTPSGLAARHDGDDLQPVTICALAFSIWFAPPTEEPPKHP